MKDKRKNKIRLDPTIGRYYDLGLEAGRLSLNAEGDLERVRTMEIHAVTLREALARRAGQQEVRM